MEPAHIIGKIINATGNNDQFLDFNVAETITQPFRNLGPSVQSGQNEQASPSVKAFVHPGRYSRLATLPLMPAENCPYAEMGQECSFRCVLCNLRHECIYCGFQERQKIPPTCVSPFGDPYKGPRNTPAFQCNIFNNGQGCFTGASYGAIGQIFVHEISSPQLEGIIQEHSEESPAVNDTNIKDTLAQTRVAHRLEDFNQEHEESSLEADECDEDGIVSQAESDLLAGYACILCDEPDEAEDMVGCDLHDGWFHLSCVGLSNFPAGEWCCPFCNSTSSGRAEQQATPSRFSSANQLDSRPDSRQRVISSITALSEESQPASYNPPSVQTAPKRRMPSSKPPISAVQNLPSSQNLFKKENWKGYEKNHVIALMQEVVDEGETTEDKWGIVSSRLLSRYGVDRSGSSVKNWWNRNGRALSKIDERIVPKPDKLTTGATSPEKRRKGRQSSKRSAESRDSDHIGPDTGSRKRQKSNTCLSTKQGGKHRPSR